MEKLPIAYLLQQIPDAPKQLYVRGQFPNEDKYKFLAIIGSRKFTTYGKQVLEKLIREIVGYPIVIVSGLALGFVSLSENEQKIITLLETPLSKNELSSRCGINIIKLNILLSSMEIKGLIKEELGKMHKIY